MNWLSICLSILLLASCAVSPKPLPVKKGMIPDFRVDSGVAILNVAEADTTRKEWTSSLIELLSSELEFRGARIGSDGSRVLEVSITDISQNIFYGLMANKCAIRIDLLAGDGLSKRFEVHDVSGMSVQRACEFSLTKGVAAILSDSEVLGYLEGD